MFLVKSLKFNLSFKIEVLMQKHYYCTVKKINFIFKLKWFNFK